jgi:hypothetical protein
MAESTPALEFNVIQVDDDSDAETPLGRVAVDPGGGLRLLRSEPGRDAFLQGMVAAMNAKPALHVRVPAPAGSPPFTVWTRAVKRGDGDFLAALKDHLRHYYDVKLER